MNTMTITAEYLNDRSAATRQAKRIEEHARTLGLTDAECVASDGGGVTLTTALPIPAMVLRVIEVHYGAVASISVSGRGSVGIVL